MKAPLWRLASTVLIVILVIGSPGQGQVSGGSAEEAQSASTVLLEARVLSIPKGALGALGLLPETGESTDLKNFLIPLAESESRSLAGDPRAKIVHSLTLHATAGNRTQFRIDTRVPGNSSAPIDTYFLIGIGIEATPTVRSNRVVSLLTGSVVQIRRGPGPNRGVAPLLYETPLTRHEVQVPDGMTILLGGFAGGANVPPVPEMAEVPGNPVYNYVMSKGPRSEDDPEIVVMLTPHLPGAPAAAPKVPAITAVPPAPSNPEPVAVARAVPPAVTPNRLIPDSILTTPSTTPQVSMPVSVPPAEQARIDLPAPASALPLPARPAPPTRPSPPAVQPKQLIPAAVASAPRSTPEVPLPISVKLAPATKLYLPVPTSPLPGPQRKTELPTLISSAWTPAPRANSPYVIATEPAVTASEVGSATTARTVAPSVSAPSEATPVNAFHSVQVGAFRDRSRAEALAAEMKKKFGGAFIESEPSARTPYRVRVGHLHDLASARKLQRRLRALGFDSFVVFPTSI